MKTISHEEKKVLMNCNMIQHPPNHYQDSDPLSPLPLNLLQNIQNETLMRLPKTARRFWYLTLSKVVGPIFATVFRNFLRCFVPPWNRVSDLSASLTERVNLGFGDM